MTRAVLERYQRHLFYHRKVNGEPLDAVYQHAQLATLQGFFKWATRQNHLPANPASDLELPRMESRLPEAVLTPAEAEKVLSQPDVTKALGIRDRAMLEVLYSTGMRRKELSELTVYSLHADAEDGDDSAGEGEARTG